MKKVKMCFYVLCIHATKRKSSRKEFIGDSLNSSAIIMKFATILKYWQWIIDNF